MPMRPEQDVLTHGEDHLLNCGRVINMNTDAGTTEWAHGLAASDPFVTRITRNVLKRFLEREKTS